MRIDAKTPLWAVTDPTPASTLPDVCFETTLPDLRLQFLGGLDMDRHPVLYDTQYQAVEDAKDGARLAGGPPDPGGPGHPEGEVGG